MAPNRLRHVFLNIPFDAKFERLYLALIAGLAGLGLIPRSVLQLPARERRLNRIVSSLVACRASIHDLSRIERDPKPPKVPRFNMPFEAGLAYAISILAQGRKGSPRHDVFIFEAVEHRLTKSCSDLDGTDPGIHRNTVVGVLQSVTKAFQRPGAAVSVDDLLRIYRVLSRVAKDLKRSEHTNSLYSGVLFTKLAYAAQKITEEMRLTSGKA
jgi:hypothetical protein